MELHRQLAQQIPHFRDKLIIIYGPRQVGKTYLITRTLRPNLILNMDVAAERAQCKDLPTFITQWYGREVGPFPDPHTGAMTTPAVKPVVFLDEIHKVRGWRDILKGTFDKTAHAIQYVASGSSAFQLRQQEKGDSLAGRAIWLPMHPVTFREYVMTVATDLRLPPPWEAGRPLHDTIRAVWPQHAHLRSLWDTYARFGGFPENLVRQDPVFFEQWLTDYIQAMLDRDLKDLHAARDVDRVHQVFRLLLGGSGSTYSLRSIAATLHVAPDTVKGDVAAIRQVLWGFEVAPAALSLARQIRKEKKFYPVDPCFYGYLRDDVGAARFECTVACALHRALPPADIGYYRDYTHREIDFIVGDRRRPLIAIECKLQPHVHHLTAFAQTVQPREAFLVVAAPGIFEPRNDYSIVSIELIAVM
ncbi:MAG: ATP-binding protein [Deltaproteobacteria bacterium]|nr:ATP-binding protein [Deltaproteobacteria bacterium]